jgi:hypothetical protein
MASKRLDRVAALTAFIWTPVLFSCTSGDSGPRIGYEDPTATQVATTKVTLPPPPTFQKEHAPEKYPDGSYSVFGVRANVKTTLNQIVRVKGFIVELSERPPCPKGTKPKDCPLGEKPSFYLADRASGPKDKGILVGDLPKKEKNKKPDKDEISFEVGNQYYISGTFAKSSPQGFSDSEGLLVYSDAKLVSAE